MSQKHVGLPAYLEQAFSAARLASPAVVDDLVSELERALDEGRLIFLCGNDGSTATASHVCEDFGKGTLSQAEWDEDDAKRLRILSLTDNTPYILAWANDGGVERIFVEQLKNLASPGDILIAISGSGNSENVLRAVDWGNEHGMTTWGVTGFDGGDRERFPRANPPIARNSPIARQLGPREDRHSPESLPRSSFFSSGLLFMDQADLPGIDQCPDPRVHGQSGKVSLEVNQRCSFGEPPDVVNNPGFANPTGLGSRLPAPVKPLRWSVGVTTAPRANPTLERCLASLALAGWDHPRIFAEPDVHVPAGLPVTRRASRMGAWPNWYLSLAELVLLDPLADCYFLSQDDVVFAQYIREFLERDLWPDKQTGVVSLYCPSIYHGKQRLPNYGPHEVAEGFGLVGALTYLFPAASARAILQDAQVVEHRLKGRRRGLCNIDAVVGRWARQTGRKVYYYSPALAAHIGETSSIWPNQPARTSRTGHNFLGEQFDARTLLK